MTQRVILEDTAREHLGKELTAGDDLLGLIIVLQRCIGQGHVLRSQGLSGL